MSKQKAKLKVVEYFLPDGSGLSGLSFGDAELKVPFMLTAEESSQIHSLPAREQEIQMRERCVGKVFLKELFEYASKVFEHSWSMLNKVCIEAGIEPPPADAMVKNWYGKKSLDPMLREFHNEVPYGNVLSFSGHVFHEAIGAFNEALARKHRETIPLHLIHNPFDRTIYPQKKLFEIAYDIYTRKVKVRKSYTYVASLEDANDEHKVIDVKVFETDFANINRNYTTWRKKQLGR